MKRAVWITFASFAIIIGFYPMLYFIIDRKFGLLGTKNTTLLNDTIWNINFYTHIILGGVALLIGWLQFNTKFRNANIALHKKIGKFYIICVLLSAIASIYIAFYATGGIVTTTAFLSLGIIWFYTTLSSFLAIKKGQIIRHQHLMIYSYAATFGAVTLRIWLPLFTWLFGSFFKAYPLAAWMAFVPNLAIAYFIVKSKKSKLKEVSF